MLGYLEYQEYRSSYRVQGHHLAVHIEDTELLQGPSLDGVSVGYLRDCFLQEVANAGFAKSSTVYEIEEQIIRGKGAAVVCPLDGRMGASYVHSLGNDPNKVGTATYMLSYCWHYTVGDIVDTLIHHCISKNMNPYSTYIWICCLCVNQHRVIERTSQGSAVPFEVFRGLFFSRVKSIGHILAMLTPWAQPIYLTRIWCIFEIYTASTNAVQVTILMPPRERDNMLEAIGQDGAGLQQLYFTLANTKIENANTSLVTDKNNILALVKQLNNLKALNLAVNMLLRTWVKKQIIDYIKTNQAESVTHYVNFGRLFYKNMEHKLALKFFRLAAHSYEASLKHGGLDDPELKVRILRCLGMVAIATYQSNTAVRYACKAHNCGNRAFQPAHPLHATTLIGKAEAFHAKGDLKRAVKEFKKAASLSESVNGRRSRDHQVIKAHIHKCIGRINYETKQLPSAFRNCQKAAEIYETIFGEYHPDTAEAYFWFGRVHIAMGNPEEGLKILRRASEMQEAVLGANHISTARTYGQIGVALAKRSYIHSDEYLNESLEIHNSILGPDHPLTGEVRMWLGFMLLCPREVPQSLSSRKFNWVMDHFQNAHSCFSKKGSSRGQYLNLAECLRGMGIACQSAGNYAQAVPYFGRSLKLLHAVYGKETSEMRKIRKSVADSYVSANVYAFVWITIILLAFVFDFFWTFKWADEPKPEFAFAFFADPENRWPLIAGLLTSILFISFLLHWVLFMIRIVCSCVKMIGALLEVLTLTLKCLCNLLVALARTGENAVRHQVQRTPINTHEEDERGAELCTLMHLT